jgi:prepilin-type N-terminal cleavage/methylation domain-containing protein/prepilin-type processing-associated H-X9-DG protein
VTDTTHTRPTHNAATSGFTLVELLVVIAVIGILISMLLPAVQSARESARRLVCSSNIRQLALAVLNYENARRIFPPATTGEPDEDPGSFNGATRRATWVVKVMPFMEQQDLYSRYDDSVSPADARNATVRSATIPIMLCPSDSFNRQPFMGSQGTESASFGDNWARGNYGANSSLAFLRSSPTEYDYWSGSSPEGWGNNKRRCVMGFNTAIARRQMNDGSSKTALLLELRAGISAFDARGVWALGNPGSATLWGHGGSTGNPTDGIGPNDNEQNADDVINCPQLRDAHGGALGLAGKGMPCWGNAPMWDNPLGQGGSRSMHAGGVMVSFCDGSARWINDSIDVLPSTLDSLSVWDKILLSADGQVAPNGDF